MPADRIRKLPRNVRITRALTPPDVRLKDIAEDFGLTPSRVRQIEIRTLIKAIEWKSGGYDPFGPVRPPYKEKRSLPSGTERIKLLKEFEQYIDAHT